MNSISDITSVGQGEISSIEDLLNQVATTIENAGTVEGEGRFTDYKNNGNNVGLTALKEKIRTDLVDNLVKIDDISEEDRIFYDKAKKDFENGEMDKSTFDSIENVLANYGSSAFLNNPLQKKLIDELSNSIASNINKWLRDNTTFLQQNHHQ
ncbi:hypothetical protein ACFQ4N_10035 [Oceanobacillus iheyensis]|uniref:Uncharacterized protein n=1 Tax=Oceanobacillus iheyensis (strain DSM 14371 / CIP 107618 / JCM 11309 / KCTC 3954 / HTE831) TaxID=221109 RepID=Q8ERH7_OCEIH|nr:hypothetical protein [Oceanobacillus iheyensis]BAC13281.1 hypothetical protein [Oceanobacillus iheyensis HTE831]